VEVAANAGLSIETVRKIEHGLVPTPAFFTVAAMAAACGVGLDELADRVSAADPATRFLSA
jgi:transcriptional regulator with XRE-family HTH domain